MTAVHRDCIDWHPDGGCSGPVEYHSVDPGRAPAFKRCAHHWEQRLERREQSLERYENSDVPPPWFDPTLDGESWDGE